MADESELFGSRKDLHRLSETPVPDWVLIGESVIIRPYNSTGVISFVGPTEFSHGTWVGVDLDAPTGIYFLMYSEHVISIKPLIYIK